MTEAEQWEKLLQVPADAGSLAVCRAFEQLASTLAPHEFDRRPFYAMPTSALPPKFSEASRYCGGWYSDWCYFWMRASLPDDRGIGPAVVVHDVRNMSETHDYVRSFFVARGEPFTMADIEEVLAELPTVDAIDRLCRILTHELAHAVDSLESGEFDCWLEVVERPAFTLGIARGLDRTVERAQQLTGPEPYLESHALRFTRIMAHLDYRLRAIGVHAELVAAGERYGQRSFADCCVALENEPAEFCDKSFAEILSMPMPPAFQECLLSGVAI